MKNELNKNFLYKSTAALSHKKSNYFGWKTKK